MMMYNWEHAYFYSCGPDSDDVRGGVLLMGRDKPLMAPKMVNCFGSEPAAILHIIRQFLFGVQP